MSIGVAAWSGDGEPDTTLMHVCLDGTVNSRDHLWLNGTPATSTVFIRADDLGEAQRLRTRVRREHKAATGSGSSLSVILELEVHIATEARTARKELASSSTGEATTVRYVGTPSGLAGLITDIKSASVADGVKIIPVVDSRRAAVGHRIVAEVMPLLAAHNV